jgi:hypothetical protein
MEYQCPLIYLAAKLEKNSVWQAFSIKAVQLRRKVTSLSQIMQAIQERTFKLKINKNSRHQLGNLEDDLVLFFN